MKYVHYSVFAILGLTHRDETDIDVIGSPESGLRALLTNDPDTLLYHRDKSFAILCLVAKAQFTPESDLKRTQELVEEEIESIRERRREKFKNRLFLVIEIAGEVDDWAPTHEYELDDYVVCADGSDKYRIKEKCDTDVSRIIGALSSGAPEVVSITKVTHGTVFEREDGKPIYARWYTAGSGRGVISAPVGGNVDQIKALFEKFKGDRSVDTCSRLVRDSFEEEPDALKSFIAAWTALEVLVNKVFKTYRDEFFDRLDEVVSNMEMKLCDRIKTVMDGKYTLVDRFSFVCIGLVTNEAEANKDIADFKEVKGIRDRLLHGEDFSSKSLPTEKTRQIVRKYLRLHLMKKDS